MERLPAMNEFLAAIYRQHTQQTAQNNLNKVQNQVQYLESFKELLQKRQEDEKKVKSHFQFDLWFFRTVYIIQYRIVYLYCRVCEKKRARAGSRSS